MSSEEYLTTPFAQQSHSHFKLVDLLHIRQCSDALINVYGNGWLHIRCGCQSDYFTPCATEIFAAVEKIGGEWKDRPISREACVNAGALLAALGLRIQSCNMGSDLCIVADVVPVLALGDRYVLAEVGDE